MLYCHFFCQSERHAARTQIQVRKFVSTLLQLYIFITAVTDWCEQRLEKCIVFIMYVYSYKERKEEKKHYHNINFGCDWGMIKMFKIFSLFPGLREQPPSPKRASLQLKNKDYCKMQEVERRLQTRHTGLQRLKDMHRNRRNRRRPKTEEEKARTNELACLRVAKSR